MSPESNVITLHPTVTCPTLGSKGDGSPIVIDLEKLLNSRLFIQAMSGGGKSYALRRLLEQTHGMVQQIVVDPEGELVTLADEFDFIVCSPDSQEAPILPGSGAAVAKAIYLSGRSAILNLSEFEIEDAQDFLADFIRQLMKMPKDTWHHTLIAVDEIQLFAPQQDKAESKKPLIDLAGRGRKRGLCLAGATQRVSLVVKSVLASLEAKMIGVTTLPIDVEKVADQLGMRLPAAQEALRGLGVGEFLVYGTAFSTSIDKVKIGPVRTTHGSLGKFTGIASPTLSREDLLSQIQSVAVENTPKDPVLNVINDNPRYAAIKPILDANERGSAAVLKRAKALNISRATLYRWLDIYSVTGNPESLMPERKSKANDALVAFLLEEHVQLMQASK